MLHREDIETVKAAASRLAGGETNHELSVQLTDLAGRMQQEYNRYVANTIANWEQ